MWILDFLPNWLFHIITLSGIAGIIVSLVPLIPYKQIIQIVSIIVLAFGFFAQGALSQQEEYLLQQEILKNKIAQLEARGVEKTVEIVTKYVNKYTVVSEKADEIIREVPVYISEKSDAACTLSNGFLMLHSDAVNNQISDPTRTSNEDPSDVKLSAAGKVIAENYKKYHQLSLQLKSLQEWILEQEKIMNEKKK